MVESATLSFNKDVDDIEEPLLMPEEWYIFEVAKKPETRKNKAMEENPSSEKAGHNWVVQLRSLVDEAPEFTGRIFNLNFPLPADGDDEKYTPRGMLVYDQKMERIANFCLSFQGTAVGTDVSIPIKGKGQGYMKQGIGLDGEIVNELSPFGEFKPLDEEA